MGTLFFLMGKSSTGKDSIYRELLKQEELSLKRIVGYTTRPVRKGEKEGEDYFFCTEERLKDIQKSGCIIELRSYPTIHGDWKYFTVDDGQIDFSGKDMLMIGTLESFIMIKKYYPQKAIVPIYIEVEDGIRLQRAIDRERAQTKPRYEELCRRFLADSGDFSPERLKKAGIERSFKNEDIENTIAEITKYIKTQTER